MRYDSLRDSVMQPSRAEQMGHNSANGQRKFIPLAVVHARVVSG
jgi:hypothetical protein